MLLRALSVDCGLPQSQTYDARAAASEDAISFLLGTACGRGGRNHPAESQERGMENSDQPQSRQTCTSGEGVMGG